MTKPTAAAQRAAVSVQNRLIELLRKDPLLRPGWIELSKLIDAEFAPLIEAAKAALKNMESLEAMLACYRVQRRPSESLLKRLAETDGAEHALATALKQVTGEST